MNDFYIVHFIFYRKNMNEDVAFSALVSFGQFDSVIQVVSLDENDLGAAKILRFALLLFSTR